MIAPRWLGDLLAAVVLAVALFSAARLSAARLIASRGRRRPCEADADGVHVLMGVAMAGMFVPGLSVLPAAQWEPVFAAGAGWFAWRAISARRSRRMGLSGWCCRYPLPHLVDCVAMLYALWAVPVLSAASGDVVAGMSGGMASGGSGLRLPVVGLALAVCICGYVVWLGDRIQLVSSTPGGSPASGTRAPAALGPPVAAKLHDRDRFPVFFTRQSVTIMDPVLDAGAGEANRAGKAEVTFAGLLSPVLLAGRRPLLAPRAAACCKIAMGVAMGVMLIGLR